MAVGTAAEAGTALRKRCYQIVELSQVIQAGEIEMKPKFMEMELLRLCSDWDLFPEEIRKSLAAAKIKSGDLDNELARVLRTNANTDSSNVNLMCLYGKQLGVKQQLRQLDCWENDSGEQFINQGIYCVQSKNQRDGKKSLIMFAWLHDEYFLSSKLRDIATYMLRYLTSMSHTIVCCLADDDIGLLRRDMERLAASSNDAVESLSFSASFQVLKEEDTADKVDGLLEKTLSLPYHQLDAQDVILISGKFLGTALITKEMDRPTYNDTLDTFHSFPHFLCKLQTLQHKHQIDLRDVADKFDHAQISELLKKFDKWPATEMHIKNRQTAACSTKICMETTINTLQEELFAVKERKSGLLEFYEKFLDQTKRKVFYNSLSPEDRGVIEAPLRLQSSLNELITAFNAQSADDFYQIMADLIKPIPEHDVSSPAYAITPIAVASREVFVMTKEAESHISNLLQILKLMWKNSINSLMKVANNKIKNQFMKWEREEANKRYEIERATALTKALYDYVIELHTDSKPVLKVVEFTQLCSKEIAVKFQIPKVVHSVTSVVIHRLETSDNRWQSLGKIQVGLDADVVSIDAVTSFCILLIVTQNQSTKLTVIDLYNGKRNILQKDFPKKANLTSFHLENRALAVLYESDADHAGKIQLYRFSESYSSMQNVNVFDLGNKVNLKCPLTDITMTSNAVYITGAGDVTQTINTKTQSTSKKFSLKQDKRKCKLLSVDSTPILVYVRLSKGEDKAYKPTLCAIAQDNHRLLPEFTLDTVKLLDENVSVGCSDGKMYILDKTACSVYAIQVFASVRSDSYQIRQSTGPANSERSSKLPLEHWLRAFYHLFDKYPIRGALERKKAWKSSIRLILSIQGTIEIAGEDVETLLKCFLQRLMTEMKCLNKPMKDLDLEKNHFVGLAYPDSDWIYQIPESTPNISLHEFLVHAITFIPVQICRAEKNSLTVLSDARDLSPLGQSAGMDAVAIARNIRFGLQSVLLESWAGQCIVMSSMGKQSTGKSYFLNHLTGSSFAISGMRCTDGAWMSFQILENNILLVVLDFEGLGSFERSIQEDVFLSVLNSSISLFTVFRIEMRYDKDADEMFNKFQKGMRLIKGDKRLFRGTLFMSVKDVNPSDADDVLKEFESKFEHIIRQNTETNFITEMYRGALTINYSPPLGTAMYYKSMEAAARMVRHDLVEKDYAGYRNGKDFLDCMRLVLAKLSILDWSSVDENAQKLKRMELSLKVPGAVRTGCLIPEEQLGICDIPSHFKENLLSGKDGSAIQISFDNLCTSMESQANAWKELDSKVSLGLAAEDDAIDFAINLDSKVMTDGLGDKQNSTLAFIYSTFENLMLLRGMRRPQCKNFVKDFDTFLSFLVHRRIARVRAWSASMIQCDEWNLWQEQLLGRFEAVTKRCQHRCSKCKLDCMRLQSHTKHHECMKDHICRGYCVYCKGSEDGDNAALCYKEAGHEGECECKMGDHTCGEPCSYTDAPNCEKKCGARKGHKGKHQCSVKTHICSASCSAATCKNKCIVRHGSPHALHKCYLKKCLQKCTIKGCERQCAEKNHFHGHNGTTSAGQSSSGGNAHPSTSTGKAAIHICSAWHKCAEMCENDGICMRNMQIKKSTQTFAGRHQNFQYTLKEINALRMQCSVMLKPGKECHTGKHLCTTSDKFSLHYCNARCPCCDYFCDKKYGHAGMHATSHGNMKHTIFLADVERIDVGGRVYDCGETGIAEMCNVYCSKMGRGHVHYIKCDGDEGACTYAGHVDERRHCTKKLKPVQKGQMDEVLHGRYWESQGWEDPCPSVAEQREFGLCPYRCDAKHDDEVPSYCGLKAFHLPSLKKLHAQGHEFTCKHDVGDSYHHIFVLDSSGSMEGNPWTALMGAYREYVYNRSTDIMATNDVVSIITFDYTAEIVYEQEPISQMGAASAPYRGGGTHYSKGLKTAGELLSRTDFSVHKPALIFFSDGQPQDVEEAISACHYLSKRYGQWGLQTFVVGFGHVVLETLETVAEMLEGKFLKVAIGNELKTTFCNISASLGSRAGLLAVQPTVSGSATCALCQRGGGKLFKLKCKHTLHKRCLQKLKRTAASPANVRCPICC